MSIGEPVSLLFLGSLLPDPDEQLALRVQQEDILQGHNTPRTAVITESVQMHAQEAVSWLPHCTHLYL